MPTCFVHRVFAGGPSARRSPSWRSLTPSVVLAANITVNAIPGKGWVQSPDNTAGMKAKIVARPSRCGCGRRTAFELHRSAAASDFTGISLSGWPAPLMRPDGRSVRVQLYGLQLAATPWLPDFEAASLRFAMFRFARDERVHNDDGGASGKSAAQHRAPGNGTSFGDTTMVWRTIRPGTSASSVTRARTPTSKHSTRTRCCSASRWRSGPAFRPRRRTLTACP